MGRRPRKSNKGTTSKSTSATDDDVEFDPDKLSIVVEGQSKSFGQWTLDYADHYYPQAGHKTYRVPPVDFNTMPLTEDPKLGFSHLGTQKEENRKKDRSQADVGNVLESLGRRLEEECGEEGGGRGLFIVGNAQYDNYLSDLKWVKAKGTPPPMPGKVASRGELDFLVLHPQVGIVLVQVKGVGFADSWNPTEEQRKAAKEKKVREAHTQLVRDDKVLQHVLGDLQLTCGVHGVVALPFVTKSELETLSLPTGTGTRYLCSDDMQSVDTMLTWWRGFASGHHQKALTDLQLRSIVGRYCGLMSTVSVWCKSSLRVEVRDVAEAAEEVGARFASIVLTTDQRDSLDCTKPYVFLYGPPGSGKSVMLVVKARQWLLEGHDVCVLNPDFGRPGMPVGFYIHDSIVQWLHKVIADQEASDSSGGSGAEKGLQRRGDNSNNKASQSSKSAAERSAGSSEADQGVGSGSVNAQTTTGSVFQAEMKGAQASPNESAKRIHPVGASDTPFRQPENLASVVSPGRKTSICRVSSGDASEEMTGTDSGFSDPDTSTSQATGSSSEADSTKELDLGRVFHVDFDFGENGQVQDDVISALLDKIKQHVRPGVPCHFVWDEFYWKAKLNPVVKALRREFPDSCVWCAEVSSDNLPPEFKPIMLKTVLRCPPTVQAVLKRTDPHKENHAFYTDDSTVHGLPTDGFKPHLIQHQNHSATSTLDCCDCADDLLAFFREELKLRFGEDGEHSMHQASSELDGYPEEQSDQVQAGTTQIPFDKDTESVQPGSTQVSVDKCGKRKLEKSPEYESCDGRGTTGAGPFVHQSDRSQQPPIGGQTVSRSEATGLTSPKKQSLRPSPPIPKRKKKRNVCHPRRVKFSDIAITVSYPRHCMLASTNLLIVNQNKSAHYANIQNSPFYRRLQEEGLPIVFCTPESGSREIALPGEDRVLCSVTNAVTGLERKVVVYVPCESSEYSYPTTNAGDTVEKTGNGNVAANTAEHTLKLMSGQSPCQNKPDGDSRKLELNDKRNLTQGEQSGQPIGERRTNPTNQLDGNSACLEMNDKRKQSQGEQSGQPVMEQTNPTSQRQAEQNRPVQQVQAPGTSNPAKVETPQNVVKKDMSIPDTENPATSAEAARVPLHYDMTSCFSEEELQEYTMTSYDMNDEATSRRADDDIDGGATSRRADDDMNATSRSADDDMNGGATSRSPDDDMNDTSTSRSADDAIDDGAVSQSQRASCGGLSEEEWEKIKGRLLVQNQRGMFYAASRCLSLFVLIVP